MWAKHGPDHGHTDRPRSVSNAKSEIGIVRLLVLPVLHVVNNFGNSGEDIWCKGLLKRTISRVPKSSRKPVSYSGLKLLKKRLHVVGRLDLCRGRHLSLHGSFDRIWGNQTKYKRGLRSTHLAVRPSIGPSPQAFVSMQRK